MSAIEVIAPGPLALFQDGGRPGYAAVGVGLSGAVDRGAYELGARMVAHGEGLQLSRSPLAGLLPQSTERRSWP
ncbi:hypothetical protein [Ornithinimicrobium sp. INDO-MA30-4]|uniref:hypothetical protein n=1 Tax=Ornithinimicrobium sp. INDO-MA30-4 TaxID=2908651 RepID=UPI002883151F|nr:hypothetical protein [Ornithinimicrobium sp. INDO-MA30-4]